jgi:hypothetical protein
MLQAISRGTYIIPVTFYDESNALMVPKTATWSLYDKNGNIVNGRSAQTIITSTSSVIIVLKGNDLIYSQGGRNEECSRTVVVEGTYDSTYGNDLPFTEEASFTIRPSSRK